MMQIGRWLPIRERTMTSETIADCERELSW
jgi:hypothetical protein